MKVKKIKNKKYILVWVREDNFHMDGCIDGFEWACYQEKKKKRLKEKYGVEDKA